MQQILIECQSKKDLEETAASLIIIEFQKPGLILLPSGKTFEEKIYPMVNQHFAQEQVLQLDLINHQENLQNRQNKIHPGLRLSHLDELINEDGQTFSYAIKNSLSNVIKQLNEDFFAIDINNPESFERFLKSAPRLIFMGLGSDPDNAHVAFIGEEFINSATTIVNLGASAAKQHNCKQGLTIGTDIFRSPGLECIYVVAQGQHKAKALKAAFNNDETGLGYLIKNHADKLKIIVDREALS